MKIQFLGAAGTVTGSKTLIEHGNEKFLVDCGLFQGLKELRLRNWAPFPVAAAEIRGVLLSHAHLDHSGYLPKLVREGFQGTVHSTPGTRALADILLHDSAYLMEEDSRYANEKGFSKHRPALPLYGNSDVKRAMKLFQPHEFNASIPLGPDLHARFARAGHILGASTVRVTTGEGSLLFSGDLGRPRDPVMHAPSPIGEVDYLVVESTYGDRRHESESPLDQLEQVVNETVEKKGVLIIPAFAVGRSQMILYYLSQLKEQNRLPNIPVFLDSPMASNVTELYCAHDEDHRLDPEQCRRLCAVARHVSSPNESESLDSRKEPMIILSASGMATGGRVLHHLKAFAPHERNTVLFAGYQAMGTRGADMIAGKKSIKIHGAFHQVRASVKTMNNLSAHADSDEILEWMGTARRPPKRTFVTHGDPEAANALATRIREEMGWDCVVPKNKQVANLWTD